MAKTRLTLVFEYDEDVPKKDLDQHITSEIQHAIKYPSDFAVNDYLVAVEILHGKIARKKVRKSDKSN